MGVPDIEPGQYEHNSFGLISINTENLSAEDQNKLINITNLQNMIEYTKNAPTTTFVKETRIEPSIRRELTEREKVELELKKWNRSEQKRVMIVYNSRLKGRKAKG
jgi:hypothetical protein